MCVFTKKSAIKKCGTLEEIKNVIIQLKWNVQDKGMILIGFLFYRSHGASWETGLQDRYRTIKRGSQLSFSVSFVESSNLCILGIIFLGSYLAFIHVRIQSLCSSPYQALVHQKQISYTYLIAFLIFEVLPVRLLLERSNSLLVLSSSHDGL